MKKIIALIIFALLFSGSLYSQSSWEKKIVDSTMNLTKVIFLNTQTGYIYGSSTMSGNPNRIYKTINSGDNWFNVYQSGNLSGNLCFLNTDFGYTTTIEGVFPYIYSCLYRTLNGGTNWQMIYLTPSTGFNNLYFNNYAGWYYSSGGLYRSIDNGNSWQLTTSSSVMSKILFVDYFRGYYISSSNYLLLKTTNSGLNWFQASVINYSLTDMYFLDSLIGYVSGKSGTNSGGILKTTDGGFNWNFVYTSSQAIKKIVFPNINVGYALGDSSRIFRTSNAGSNWSAQNLDSAYRYNDLSFANAYTGFVVGQRGIVLRTMNGGATSINTISTETPSKYSLSQNYPNPFNPTTKIKFSIVSSPHGLGGDLVQLKVYNIQGREVQTLVNESLKPGTYEAAFDGSALNSGVYFYKLITNGFTETKKMLLIK